MKHRPGLQRALTTGVLAYVVLLSLAVIAQGWLVNERAERLVWESMLAIEMDYFLDHAQAPGWAPRESGLIEFFAEGQGERAPAPLAELAPGLHDEVPIDGREVVALVRVHDGQRVVLTLDITELERAEHEQLTMLALSSLLVVVLLGVVVAWGVARMMVPLRDLAQQIGQLRPDIPGQNVAVSKRASAELAVIADALNLYLVRQDQFVVRERDFIDSASHELRTPVAVIAGASELALEAGMSPPARTQVQRIQRTARSIEELISALLVLAKDPERLARTSDLIELDQLLPEIIDDHRHLCEEKTLDLKVSSLARCRVVAPIAIVQVAIGNLLRNAIENSDTGIITLELRPGAMVVIEDPGHGMSPEQISAVYGRGARSKTRSGGGIGLDLVARLCSHLGWHLQIRPRPEQRGTRATLDLSSSVAVDSQTKGGVPTVL